MESTPTQQTDSRTSDLSPTDVAGMRALFAYYDTNRDGNLSSVQALRIFQLLGLSVNEAHVYDLEQMSFAEFVTIVDCHVRFIQTPDPAAEWAAVNHFRNDKVSPQQLAYFLANCDKLIPESHLQRFLMLYTTTDEQVFVDFPNFHKFLMDYRARPQSMPPIPSDVRPNAVQAHHIPIPEGGTHDDRSTKTTLLEEDENDNNE